MKKPDFALLRSRVERFTARIQDDKLKETFRKCFFNTLDTTMECWDDGTTYIFTGDIDAMWLRDSSAQVMQYLEFAEDDVQVMQMIKGLVKRQQAYIKLDPYANAFSKRECGNFEQDQCEKRPYVWERKFELDSLCYPLWLAYKYYVKTSDTSLFDEQFRQTLDVILTVFVCEQNHKQNSNYYHYRPSEAPSLSIPNKGYGGEVKPCGLIWSGYRPSDDPCEYGYFIAGNMFVSATLKHLLSIQAIAALSKQQVATMQKLVDDIDAAISRYGIVNNGKYGDIYAYEVDGLGNANLMDDANVPSLLSIPYIRYSDAQDETYIRTRAFVLSEGNPYYFTGKCISGIGSPHTCKDYVWPISLMIQGLTSQDDDEINSVLHTLLHSDGGTCLMHEGVHKDDDKIFTRGWFAWANSLFSLFVVEKADKIRCIGG